MRNKLYAVLAAALALFGLAACGGAINPSPTPTAAKVVIGLGYKPDVQFAPFYVALHRGYYQAEGLEVEFQHGDVTDLLKQLGTGEGGVQFVAASGDEVIPARLQEVPIKYVMTWYRQYPVAAASVEGKGPRLDGPADLKGLRVGVPGPFGSNYIGLQALLKAGGLTLKDIKLETIGFTQAESLSQGQVPVAMVYAANEPVQLRALGMKVNTLMVSDYASLASNGLVGSEETLAENPELARKVIRATLRGIKDTASDPGGAFDEVVKQVPEAQNSQALQVSVLEETIKLMEPKAGDPAANQPPGWTDPAVWAATQDFLLEAGVIKTKGDVNQMFTNDFLATGE